MNYQKIISAGICFFSMGIGFAQAGDDALGPDAFVLPPVVAAYFRCEGQLSPECFYLKRHMERDTVSCSTDPQEILERSPRAEWGKQKTILGKIRYLGAFSKKYHYTVDIAADHSISISSYIKIKNRNEFTEAEVAELQARLDTAAERWSATFAYGPAGLRAPYELRFRFQIVDAKENAFYHVRLSRKRTRGPYDTEWNLQWPAIVLAHEMGHVMGLDDEYENNLGGGDASKCIQDSLMCRSWGGRPKDFHYYLILRRLGCQYPALLDEEEDSSTEQPTT